MPPTESRSGSEAAPFVRLGQRLALAWLVVALLFQGAVLQAHGHFGASTVSSTVASLDAGSTRIDRAAVVRDDRGPATPACPLCEEKALFGAYLSGGAIAIHDAPLVEAYRPEAARLALSAPGSSSHAWNSRAPPIFTA